MIWDWTTSNLLLVRHIYMPSCDLFNQNLQDSTVALDPSLPPVRFGHRFSLIDHTYCLFLSPVDSGSIRLYKFIRPSGVTTPAIHLVTLHLPPISTGISAIATTKTQAGPIMAQATSHIPLVANDEDRLYLFTLVYRASFEGPPSPISTNMFVHQRVFMNYIAQSADSGAGPPLDIPWAEWGPQNTPIIYPAYRLTSRWQNRCAGARVGRGNTLPEPLITILCGCVHGQRVVQLPRITEREPVGAPFVKVLDFSRAAVLAAQGLLPQPPSSPTNPPGVLAASSIVRHPYFQGDVETHLPCVSWTRELTKEYNDFLINEDCLIGVQVRFHPLSSAFLSCNINLFANSFHSDLLSMFVEQARNYFSGCIRRLVEVL
jgi:hypothetical protein